MYEQIKNIVLVVAVEKLLDNDNSKVSMLDKKYAHIVVKFLSFKTMDGIDAIVINAYHIQM